MARYVPKKKDVKKEISFQDTEGSAHGCEYTLQYVRAVKRFILKCDGKLVLSHIAMSACVRRAVEHEVIWNSEPVLKWKACVGMGR